MTTKKIQKNNTNQIFDEKMLSIFKKIKIPTNPIAFYINISRIEQDLSEGLRDYFYEAINEFISPISDKDEEGNYIHNHYGYNNFILKLYYYSGFTKDIAKQLNKFSSIMKYYDIGFYLQGAVYFDSNIKLKIIALNHGKIELLEIIDSISTKEEREKILKKYTFLQKDLKKTTKELMEDFTTYFYNLKDKKTIELIYKHIEIDVLKYPLSYIDSMKMSFDDYIKSPYAWYYKAIAICFSNIVNLYNREQNQCQGLLGKIQSNISDIRKYNFLKNTIKGDNYIKIGKELFSKKHKYFHSNEEFQSYLITYLINKNFYKFKKLFYWEAVNTRLSENKWAEIGGANLFYLQKIDNNIGNFNLLIFFKQFKDNIISMYNSIFWVFIKPYFYYILVFKSIKLQLKDWQKFFFILMFFSAESYEEYIILQTVLKSIERIGLWKYKSNMNWISKIIYYVKRFINLFKEFYSSVIMLILFILFLWFAGLINIIMLAIIALLIGISLLKYIFFPGRFEVLRSLGIIMLSVLAYVWFTTVFPKITQPQYISYIGQELQALVNLDFKKAHSSYEKMIQFVYGENYKNYEKKLVKGIWNKTKNGVKSIKNNKSIQKIATNITSFYSPNYISIKKGEYLKFIVDKEIDKLKPNLTKQQKQNLSKKVTEKYIQWYCSLKNDIYCKNKLENIPVGFKININKIKQLINY